MRRFVARQNVERLERMLGFETDTQRRAAIDRLLVEARRELDWLEGIWSWTCPHLNIPNSVGIEAEQFLDRVVRFQGADFGSLQLWDEAEHRLCLIAHNNFDRASVEQFASVRDGDGTVCEAAQTSRSSVVVEDIEKEDAFGSLRGWTRVIGIRAIRTTPVFGPSGKFIGAFSTHYAAPRSFSSDERHQNSINSEWFGRIFESAGHI